MRINSFKLGGLLSLILLLGLWMGCRVEGLVAEPVKDVRGTWKIMKVVRNGVDITQKVKVDGFQLDLQTDPSDQHGGTGTYKIARGAPFVVKGDGTWKLNDPVYPFTISLSPDSDPGGNVDLDFSFLIIKGKYQIKLILQPGCPANSYEYYLGKIN